MNLKNKLILLIMSLAIMLPSETYTRSLSKKQKQAIALAAKKLKAKKKTNKNKKKSSSKSKKSKKKSTKAKPKKKVVKKPAPKKVVRPVAPVVPVVAPRPIIVPVPVAPIPVAPVIPVAPIVVPMPIAPVIPAPIAPIVPAPIVPQPAPIIPVQQPAQNQNIHIRRNDNAWFNNFLQQIDEQDRRAEQEEADRLFAQRLQQEFDAEDRNIALEFDAAAPIVVQEDQAVPAPVAQALRECIICMDEKNNIVALPVCNHEFCADCIKEQATIAAREISLNDFKCPECQRQITEQDFSGMDYCREQYNSFIERRRNRENNGVQRPNIITQEDANILNETTKKCPNCNARIQRSGGCNHITCTHCRHEFCLQCLNFWIRGSHMSSVNCGPYHCRGGIEKFTPAYPTDTRPNRVQEDLVICRACNQEIYYRDNNYTEAPCGHLYHTNCYINHDETCRHAYMDTNCHTCNQSLRRNYNNYRYW